MESEVVSINKAIEVKTVVAIRRKPGMVGLPGDDPANYNIKLGSSMKGEGPLRGLSREEEREYLPDIINVSPDDHNDWLRAAKDYWCNISVSIPADTESESEGLKGKVLTFIVEFKSKDIAEKYKQAGLEKKVEIIKKAGKVVQGISNYILFRYCLVYGRVANSFEDIGKSPRIWFYLYSKDQETKREYNLLTQRNNANRLFLDIMDNESMINGILRLMNINPESLETLEDKHIVLDKKIRENPTMFIDIAKDKDIAVKATIKKAVGLNIIYNPPHTDSYYYGADNDILLGASLLDAVLFLKSNDKKKVEIRESILAQIKNT